MFTKCRNAFLALMTFLIIIGVALAHAKVAEELTVPKKQLSTYIRTKNSAKDDRPSSVSLGVLGVTTIVLVFGSLMLGDIVKVFLYVKVKLFQMVKTF